MPHRGRRSVKAIQRRAARRYVLDTSRRDRIRAENTCLITRKDVMDYLEERFDHAEVSESDFERGEILVSARGDGSLQRIKRFQNGKRRR